MSGQKSKSGSSYHTHNGHCCFWEFVCFFWQAFLFGTNSKTEKEKVSLLSLKKKHTHATKHKAGHRTVVLLDFQEKLLSSYSEKMNNQLKIPLSLKKFICICMWDTHNILRWLPFLRYEATHYNYINWCVNCGWPIHQHRKSICMALLMGLLINLPRSFAISGPVHYSHLMSPQMFSSETTWLCLSYRCNKILLQNTRFYSSGKDQGFLISNLS